MCIRDSGVAREKEIAIRIAVGAGRGRLIRQLFTESLVLAVLGSAAGLALGCVVLRFLMVWADVPAWLDATPDRRVMAFAIGMGFAAAILFGLTPAWQAARQRHRGAIARQFLIGAQVAASCILLIVAGLLVRALDRAMFAPRGFAFQHVISIDPHFHGASSDDARAYLDTLESRLRALPGVEAVSMVSNPPLGNRWTVFKTEVAGRAINIHYNHIDPPFFQTMQIPLLRGRNLTRGDTRGIVVGESLARLQWPAEDPIGKLFRTGADAYTAVSYTHLDVYKRQPLRRGRERTGADRHPAHRARDEAVDIGSFPSLDTSMQKGHDRRSMDIDARLQALTESLELLAHMHADSEHRQDCLLYTSRCV